MLKNKLPALTIFLGSFLIFGVQPMLGRTLLPAFGGTAAVWTTCLATYQVLLLVGYWYAHCLSGGRGTGGTEGTVGTVGTGGRRAMTHVGLLAVAVAWVAGFAWGRPWLMAHIGNSAYPALEVLLCVLAFAGLPYVLLSANSTLIQAWLAGGRGQCSVNSVQCSVNSGQGTEDGRPEGTLGTGGTEGTKMAGGTDVYALYAVSNAGSLLGLLCYPFLVEPFLSLDAQWYGFAGALAVYAGLLAVLAKGLGGRQCSVISVQCSVNSGEEHRTSKSGAEGTENTNALTNYRTNALLWLVLPATSTFLLNAVTAHLSTDVTPIPLLWVALLAAFLVSYIIGFSKIGEKGVLVWCVVAMVPLLFCAYAMGLKGSRGFAFSLVPGILLVLFGCIFLHGWLYRIRPAERFLTRYYLCLAAGGALGGLLSGIVAPLVFNRVLEYPIALAGLALFYAIYAWKNMPKEYRWVETVMYLGALVAIFFTFTGMNAVEPGISILQRSRNFYGCLTVSSQEIKAPYSDSIIVHRLQHGDTLHGAQFQPHYLREKPTAYFGPNGGGFGILRHNSYSNGSPMSVGVIGLGIGTLAAYGRTNDTYRFFEINPQVVDAAWNTKYFNYLSGCEAKVSVVLGDARTAITAETNRYDVLVIDAYSGDSIPFHLATKEAFRLYLDRLNPGGILAVHISNWHIDLNPLCKAVAKEWGLKITGVLSQPQGLSTAACWVFMGDRQLPVQGLYVRETDWAQVRDIALPTDACGSLINLVRYGYRTPEKPLEVDLSKIY